ncbi:hypothetical protein SAMN05216532_5233 [Streptomyces sp. 2231.1]|uniref:hypothetical protein n=1 Tax=unclassified Streptomyces TaxID=2593676 RepID=UPI000897D65B|nr:MULTISPECIES: hypothetical protein [unclassified Streptomyces]SED65412.1 hypothetical protein SAMN05216532_5233 [Streptomyces sp. 2231.1]
MKRSSGVRLCATAAVGALSLALVTGCSDEGSKGAGGAGGTDGKPAARALGTAELKKLIVAGGEVPGYKVGAVPATRAKPITTDSAECRPLARVLSGLPPAEAAAQTDRLATQERKKDPTDDATSLDDMADGKFEDAIKKSMDLDVTTVNLSSYDGDGAAKALESVSAAVRACAGGFAGKQSGTGMKFTEVAESKAAAAGDESVAFEAISEMDGDSAPVYGEVVRHGNTLASYYTVNIGAMMAKKAYSVSPEVVKAQSAKLK